MNVVTAVTTAKGRTKLMTTQQQDQPTVASEPAEKSKGASLAELMKATGWQAHSVRGFLSGTLRKKMGLKVESAKRGDGERVYSIPR